MSEPKRGKDGRWEKGETGNPKGRPKKGESMRAILGKVGDEMQTVDIDGKSITATRKEILARLLFENMFTKDENGTVRINIVIVRELLNRAEGLPIQQQHIFQHDEDDAELSDAEVERIAAELAEFSPVNLDRITDGGNGRDPRK